MERVQYFFTIHVSSRMRAAYQLMHSSSLDDDASSLCVKGEGDPSMSYEDLEGLAKNVAQASSKTVEVMSTRIIAVIKNC